MIRPVVIGADGNMGRRYCSVLRYLGFAPIEYDITPRCASVDLRELLKTAEKVIITIPTDYHLMAIAEVLENAPKTVHVLCEKPVVKTEIELQSLLEFRREIFMVNQYAHLTEFNEFSTAKDTTHYSYYKSGDDGLPWDCVQLIQLANSSITLDNESPWWKCYINGVSIDLRHMDTAYIRMITDFMGPMQRMWGLPVIESVTRKILSNDAAKKNSNRDSGPLHFAAPTE